MIERESSLNEEVGTVSLAGSTSGVDPLTIYAVDGISTVSFNALVIVTSLGKFTLQSLQVEGVEFNRSKKRVR